MKRTGWSALLVVVGLALGFPVAAEEEGPQRARLGVEAPDFRLNDHGGRAVSFREATKDGWALLAFYPMALTPG